MRYLELQQSGQGAPNPPYVSHMEGWCAIWSCKEGRPTNPPYVEGGALSLQTRAWGTNPPYAGRSHMEGWQRYQGAIGDIIH